MTVSALKPSKSLIDHANSCSGSARRGHSRMSSQGSIKQDLVIANSPKPSNGYLLPPFEANVNA